MCLAVDHTVFYRHKGEHFLSAVSISMDNMAITGNSIEMINWIKGEFKKRFEISDLGKIKWLLGLEVNYNKDARTISISQGTYVDKLIERFGLKNTNSMSTPLEPGVTLSSSQSPSTPRKTAEMQHISYKELIGSIAWSALVTCPDISFSSLTLAQFMHNPGHAHWEAGKHDVRYLKGTCEYALNLTDLNEGIIAYVDADWGSQARSCTVTQYWAMLSHLQVCWSLGDQRNNQLSHCHLRKPSTSL